MKQNKDIITCNILQITSDELGLILDLYCLETGENFTLKTGFCEKLNLQHGQKIILDENSLEILEVAK